jgi:hypothetical protein
MKNTRIYRGCVLGTLLLLVAGCAVSVQRPSVGYPIRISTSNTLCSISVIDDRRPAEKQERRLSTSSEAALWFGDDSFDPPLTTGLNLLLCEAFPKNSITEIRLIELRAGIFRISSHASAAITRQAPRLPAIAIGDSLVRSVASTVANATESSGESWSVEMIVEIERQRFVAFKQEPRLNSNTEHGALADLLRSATSELARDFKNKVGSVR